MRKLEEQEEILPTTFLLRVEGFFPMDSPFFIKNQHLYSEKSTNQLKEPRRNTLTLQHQKSFHLNKYHL